MFIKKRIIVDLGVAFVFLPFILIPIICEMIWKNLFPSMFFEYQEVILFADILYIVLIRFILLDTMLYLFSHTPHPAHATLIRIVMLYLEITVVTISYFALLFYTFDIFSLFHLSASLPIANLTTIKEHGFITAFYISTVTFTTLGSGDWVPQTINAMLAVNAEAILGVVQGGVFVAILIYAHQNKISVEGKV